jgi:hypothetical protein
MSAIRSRRLPQWLLGVSAVAIFVLAGTGSALAEVTGAADNLRTGWYPDEPSLTPALLSGGGFKQAFKDSLKGGQIYAQPLTANGTLLVVTEENWAYGLDPYTGAVRWERQVGTPVSAGEEAGKTINCSDLAPHVGITGTPVIDTDHNIAYFVANRYIENESGPIAWYMHAVELNSGKEIANFPVEINGTAQNLPSVKFEAAQELQRPALLMMNGVVYAGFGSHCDHSPYEGWLVGVPTAGGTPTKWATSGHGGSIWQSGGGLISDGPGQILFSTGNDDGVPGEWDPPKLPGSEYAQVEGKLGESVVRAEVQPDGTLATKDFFSPFNNKELDEGDVDLGSSAPIALPSQYFGTPSTPNLLVQDGKEGRIYLLNRDSLGGMGQGLGGTDQVVQRLEPYGGVWGGAAAWPGDGGYVYIPTVGGSTASLLSFKYGIDKTEPTLSFAAKSPEEFAFGSGSPIVTSSGTTSGTGVVWITRCPENGCENAKLVAYSPVSPGNEALHVLWEAPIGTATKFSRPDASNGHIYVGNREGALFGFGHPESKEEREAKERTEREAKEKSEAKERTERETKKEAERIAKEEGEREAKEKTERQAKEKPESTLIGGVVTTAGLIPPLAHLTPVTLPSPANLTKLTVRVVASRPGSHRRKALVTYTLSATDTVGVAAYHRVISHSCRRGAGACVRWVRTKIELRLAGHEGTNVSTLDLGRLSAGDYRIGAMPIAQSGTSGVMRYAYFKIP